MRRVAGAAFLAAAGCTPITGLETSPAPVNLCTDISAPCSGYDGGADCEPTLGSPACQENAAIADFVLVVTLPALGPVNEGASSTYVIDGNDVLVNLPQANVCLNYPLVPGSLCFQLGKLQNAFGGYLVSPTGVEQADRPLGAPVDAYKTLPVSVTYWPFWNAPANQLGGGRATDARLLNLPLPPVIASVSDSFNTLFSGLTVDAPGGGNPISWSTALPPSLPGYLGEIRVSTPFDDGFPDLTYSLSVPDSDTAMPRLLGVEEGATATFSSYPPAPATLTVKRADGSALGSGWKIYSRDQPTQRRVTSTATGTSTAIHLNQISVQPVTSHSELVVEPPEGAVLPTLVDTTSGIQTEIYPDLPPVVHVSGSVVAPDGNPVSASLLFFSNALDSMSTCEAASNEAVSAFPPLVYESSTETLDLASPRGTKGAYSIDLPQGRYNVVIDPTADSGYAKSVAEINSHIAARGTPVCSGSPITLSGVTLDAQDPSPVSGSVRTADGRPMANATVQMTPASAYAGGRFQPVALPTGASPASGIALPEVEWPRPFQTTTGLDGSFTLTVDYCGPNSYCYYDLTVRPEDGTNFPWLVRPQREYGPRALPLEPLTVPPPFYLNLTLEDDSGSLLTGAVVQAFAFSDGVAVAIGDALTDENGHFTMMLSTAFAPN